MGDRYIDASFLGRNVMLSLQDFFFLNFLCKLYYGRKKENKTILYFALKSWSIGEGLFYI